MPTIEQAFGSVRVCQMLSNLYRTIHLFRYDQNFRTIFILTKSLNNEELQIVILPNGLWRFIDDETQL